MVGGPHRWVGVPPKEQPLRAALHVDPDMPLPLIEKGKGLFVLPVAHHGPVIVVKGIVLPHLWGKPLAKGDDRLPLGPVLHHKAPFPSGSIALLRLSIPILSGMFQQHYRLHMAREDRKYVIYRAVRPT